MGKWLDATRVPNEMQSEMTSVNKKTILREVAPKMANLS